MTTVFDSLDSDPNKWAAEFCSQGGLLPESGRPGGFTYEFFVAAMGAVESEWRDRMQQIVAELDARTLRELAALDEKHDIYFEGRADAYDVAAQVVRQIGELDD